MVEIEVEKEIDELDRYVCSFVNILKKYTEYVIVSGYIAIILGLKRPTFDVDILVRGFYDEKTFNNFYTELKSNGFNVVERSSDAYKILLHGHTLTIHTPSIYYFDFKLPRDRWGWMSLKNPLLIKTPICELLVAPPEIQIPYKLRLGSDKDIKDAVFLYERLKPIIDMEKMELIAGEMGVDLEVIL